MSINTAPDITLTGNDVFQSTSFNIPIPSGVSVGCLLMIGVTFANVQANSTAVTIAGWTSFGATGGNNDKYAFYKIADSGDAAGGNWVCSCTDGFIEQWAIAGWNGVDTSTPFSVGPSINTGGTINWTWNSITSPGTGSVWVGLNMLENNSTSQTDPTPPPTNQVMSSDPGLFFSPVTIFSTVVNSGGFTATGSQGAAFEWANIAMFLNPLSIGTLTPTPTPTPTPTQTLTITPTLSATPPVTPTATPTRTSVSNAGIAWYSA